MTTYAATLFRQLGAQLAEGPVWHDDALWLVDIARGELHRLTSRAEGDTKWKLGDCLTAIVPARDGRWLAVLRHEAAWFDATRAGVTPFSALAVPAPSSCRFNDAKCDAAGRLWLGTMSLDGAMNRCALYRIDQHGVFDQVLTGITASNGLGWSPDNTRFYYVDTATRRIDCFDFDLPAGALAHRRALTKFAEHEGVPDGLTIDAEGQIWVAMWGGGCVWRIDGLTGARIARVEVPTPHVTSCTFGGYGWRTLFITTAAEGLDAAGRAREPAAGSIFASETNTHGLPAARFAGA